MISSIGFVGFLTSLFRGLAVFLEAVGPHTIVVFYDVGRGKPLTSSALFLSFMLILLGSLIKHRAHFREGSSSRGCAY